MLISVLGDTNTTLAVVLGLATVVGFYAAYLPGVLTRHDTMWLMTLTAGLSVLAIMAPDPLVGIALAWIALHPWWTFVGALRGILPDVLRNADNYRNLWPVGGWAALYILSYRLSPTGLYILAVIWLLWALLNAAVVLWQWKENSPLPWAKIVAEGRPPGAFCGANWFCSYSLCLGTLSAIYLGGYFIATTPLLIAAMIPTRHYMAPISATIASIPLLPDWWWRSVIIVVFSIIILRKSSQRHRAMNARWQQWLLMSGLIYLSRGWGLGLGAVRRMHLKDHSAEDADGVYYNMHNDWLQALIELGPIPVLCAMVELTRRAIWLPPTHDAHFTLSLVVFTAVLAIAYFPLHHPSQSLILAIAMGYRNAV